MRLKDLNARFLQVYITMTEPNVWHDGHQSPDGRHVYFRQVESLAEAHGLRFDCPCAKCQMQPYKQRVHVGFANRSCPEPISTGSNGPTWWNVVGGTGLDDLQLSPSIQLLGGCNWHGFIGVNGVPPGEAQ